jgi:ATP-dependent Zn protease
LATDTKILADEKRGICCHEAGHAVVAASLNVPVTTVRVSYNTVRGWHGGTDYPEGSTDRLLYMDRVTILVAGKTAEKVFNCQAHEGAWRHDLGQIAVLLNANEILEDRHWTRITEACERARRILEDHRDKALELIDRLVECGRVERPEFLQLMQ